MTGRKKKNGLMGGIVVARILAFPFLEPKIIIIFLKKSEVVVIEMSVTRVEKKKDLVFWGF